LVDVELVQLIEGDDWTHAVPIVRIPRSDLINPNLSVKIVLIASFAVTVLLKGLPSIELM
jgi:hypothetical protein